MRKEIKIVLTNSAPNELLRSIEKAIIMASADSIIPLGSELGGGRLEIKVSNKNFVLVFLTEAQLYADENVDARD